MKSTLFSLAAVSAALLVSGAHATTLLGYYPFEGNYDDASGSGNNAAPGQNPGEVSIGGGFRGQGANINDPDATGGGNNGGTIDIPINVDPGALPNVSFGGWVNVETNNGFPGFMATDNGGWDRGLSLNSNQWSIASGGNTNSGIAPTLGEWEFVVGTFGGGSANLYVGNSSPGSVTTSVTSRDDAQATDGLGFLEIGRYDNQDFDGSVDDIFVFGDALNAHQVNAIRNLRLSLLDYSPALANDLFNVFESGAAGLVGSDTWSPTSGLDATNPGEVFDLGGGQYAVVLDDSGNGLVVPEPTGSLLGLLAAAGLLLRRRRD